MSDIWKKPRVGIPDLAIPASQNLARPEHGEVEPSKPRHEPAQTRKAAGQGGVGLRIAVGSRVAPRRESSADKIDGRAARAKGRNSRINFILRPEYLDAFKEGSIEAGIPFCEMFEAMIEERFAIEKEGAR